MDKITSWVAQCASWVTVLLGSLTLEKFAVLVGIGTSIGTFAVNWFYARKKAQRYEQG